MVSNQVESTVVCKMQTTMTPWTAGMLAAVCDDTFQWATATEIAFSNRADNSAIRFPQ